MTLPTKRETRRWSHPQQRIVWWLFDRTPKRFQDWAESWARTLVVRRNR